MYKRQALVELDYTFRPAILGRELKFDIVNDYHSHRSKKFIIVMDAQQKPIYRPEEVTIFPIAMCERIFQARGFDSKEMICGQGTHRYLPLCKNNLGSAVYYYDDNDWNVIHLFAISIAQNKSSDCSDNEPQVFMRLSEMDRKLKELLK